MNKRTNNYKISYETHIVWRNLKATVSLHLSVCLLFALPTSAEVFCLLLMRLYFLLLFIYLYSTIAVYCIKINKNS